MPTRAKGKRKNKYSELEVFAYRLGQISRGRKNPDSKISESFNNGLKGREAKPRKTMF